MGIVGRNYGTAASKRPTPVVEASRGAAAAPSAASIPAGGGGGIANDIAGLVGIGGGMLGRFLWDKYHDPKAQAPNQNGLQPALDSGVLQAPPDYTGQGMPEEVRVTGMDATLLPMEDADGNLILMGKAPDPTAVTDYLEEMQITPYITGI